ncbi:class I SAM-dependent methyltransferase [Cellulosimicrobium cellulans]|uniref:class I SAM-dependent methyltransferase n=1 Tax=Cellulosimicrobium cellulans TaxID=1710 RepID=UPI0008484C37|nr:class I SAM-dependent methyltransferase [Cellulosimicrobium cellulans]
MTAHEHTRHHEHARPHAHTGTHAHHQSHGHHQPSPEDVAAWLELLDLDAAVFADLLGDVVGRVAALAPATTRTVLDLGAGTGTGTVALALAFPDAEVVAVDSSATMLDRVARAAAEAGVADRVRTVEADLDVAWPAATKQVGAGQADVVWASASLHHVADPARVLRDAHDALMPGGLVAVVEITGSAPVLPPTAGRPGLGDRLAAATVHAGWNRYPDWTPYLEEAGFESVERTEHQDTAAPGPTTARWARVTLERLHEHLAPHLDPEDLAAVAALLDDPAFPTGVSARAGRILWSARRPAVTRTS